MTAPFITDTLRHDGHGWVVLKGLDGARIRPGHHDLPYEPRMPQFTLDMGPSRYLWTVHEGRIRLDAIEVYGQPLGEAPGAGRWIQLPLGVFPELTTVVVAGREVREGVSMHCWMPSRGDFRHTLTLSIQAGVVTQVTSR